MPRPFPLLERRNYEQVSCCVLSAAAVRALSFAEPSSRALIQVNRFLNAVPLWLGRTVVRKQKPDPSW